MITLDRKQVSDIHWYRESVSARRTKYTVVFNHVAVVEAFNLDDQIIFDEKPWTVVELHADLLSFHLRLWRVTAVRTWEG